MDEKGIKKQLDRIELYTMLAAKNVLNITEAAFILGMTTQGEKRLGTLDAAEQEKDSGRT